MNTTVELSRSYPTPNGTFNKIVLREPTFHESHMDGLGKPQDLQPGVNGGHLLMTYPTVVDAYAQRLVVEPGYEHISQISALDALRLERAICDFFMPMKPLEKPPTGSSSASESPLET